MENLNNYRVRFAPSPTGYLHVGGARTALYCYLLAKKNNGQFVLRIEDTDEERSTDENMKMQMSDLVWLGLNWDEGIDSLTLEDKGEYGPYRQSRRKHIYKEYADKLLSSGHAYYCFLTDEEVEAQREQAKKENLPLQVNSPYRDMAIEEALKKIEAGEKAVVRFKVPKEKSEFKFTDLVRGEVKFPSDMVGDFVLLRSSGMPVYNFCCVIDDALMKMTHVLRAEDHLSNTLRQMMIYDALGFDNPQFGHLSLILGKDRQKLSKRHGATSVHDFTVRGFLPEAINNYIALLGWSSPEGQEIMTMQEMIDQISTDRFNAAAPVFDEEKLTWVNATHLRALDHKDLWARTEPFLTAAGLHFDSYDEEWKSKSLSVFKSYMETLQDAVNLYRPLAQDSFAVADESSETLSWESTRGVIEKWTSLLKAQSNEFITEEKFNELQNTVKDECGVKGKHLFMPIRVSVIGKPHGAELQILVPLLPVKELINRAETVLSAMN